MTKTTRTQKTSQPTTLDDASRVQSAIAKANGGAVPKRSQASRMQRAAARNSGKSGESQ